MPAKELEIAVIPLLKDNYGYLVHDADTGKTAAVDPSVAPPMLAAAKERGWRISHILNTHHHWDHTDGNLGIKEATGAIVVGPAYDRERIPGIDQAVDEESGFNFAGHEADVLFIPGHTRGHAVLLYRERFLFTGDHLAWSRRLEQLVGFRDACWYSWSEQIRSMEKLLDFRFEFVNLAAARWAGSVQS